MPYLSQSFFKFPKYIKAGLYLKNPPLLIEILPLPSVSWTNYHIFAIKACYNCCIKITPKLRGLKPKQYFYYLLGFLWVRSLGRALPGGFGSEYVMCFLQRVAGAGTAGGWLGIFVSSGLLRASPVVFLPRLVCGSSQAVTLLM